MNLTQISNQVIKEQQQESLEINHFPTDEELE